MIGGSAEDLIGDDEYVRALPSLLTRQELQELLSRVRATGDALVADPRARSAAAFLSRERAALEAALALVASEDAVSSSEAAPAGSTEEPRARPATRRP